MPDRSLRVVCKGGVEHRTPFLAIATTIHTTPYPQTHTYTHIHSSLVDHPVPSKTRSSHVFENNVSSV